MNFIKLGESAVLNLDSIASVSWEGKGPQLAALVKYLVPSAMGQSGQGQLAYERLTGGAARALREFLERETTCSQDPGRIKSVTARVSRPAKGPTSPEPQSLDMLVSGSAKKKAWYCVNVNNRWYFLAMVNMKGSCSMRTFDADSGRFLGKQYAHGAFQEQFGRHLKNGKEVTVYRQPNLDRDCKEALPQNILSHLKGQLPAEP